MSRQTFCVPRYAREAWPELVENQRLARVLRVHADGLEILDQDGERALSFRARTAELPTAGDWLELGDGGEARSLLPRRNLLERRAAGKREEAQGIAANVDAVWIVTALDADFSVRRIERYLALAHQAQAVPVVLLSKAAECVDLPSYLEQAQQVARAAPVHAVDVLAGLAADLPARLIEPGQTAALVGSSGVGKSTLLNHLLQREATQTQAVREGDQKGRHTTTWRQLFYLPSGAAVIDTPGMREVQLWAGTAALEAVFDDVVELARSCRYRDCHHRGEPGCALAEAMARGDLDPERLDSFTRLEREVARRPVAEQRRSQRVQSRALRAWLKHKRGRE